MISLQRTDAMSRVLSRLWNDDAGAVIALEFLFVATVLILGLIVGLTALRNAINNELVESGNAILALSQGFSVSGSSTSGGSLDGSAVIDTPGFLDGPVPVAPFAPSLIDVN